MWSIALVTSSVLDPLFDGAIPLADSSTGACKAAEPGAIPPRDFKLFARGWLKLESEELRSRWIATRSAGGAAWR